MPSTARPGSGEVAPYHQRYVDLVPEGPIVETLRDQIEETIALLNPLGEERAGHRYAPGKWSIAEVVAHVADAERVFAYRALRFARGDATPLAPFDENAYVAGTNFGARTLRHLLDEFVAVRRSNVLLFESLDEAALSRSGVASGHPVTVRGILHVIAGHERHHREILRERYLAPAER